MKKVKIISILSLVSIVSVVTLFNGDLRIKTYLNSHQSSSELEDSEIKKISRKEEKPSINISALSVTEDTKRGYFNTNENGETYGTFINNGNGEITDPDLIEAVGKDNVAGYVRYNDLHSEDNVYDENNPNKKLSIPLYKKDGTTVIGEFIIDSSGVVTNY